MDYNMSEEKALKYKTNTIEKGMSYSANSDKELIQTLINKGLAVGKRITDAEYEQLKDLPDRYTYISSQNIKYEIIISEMSNLKVLSKIYRDLHILTNLAIIGILAIIASPIIASII